MFKNTALLFKYDYTQCAKEFGVNLGDYVQTIATKNIIDKVLPNKEYKFWDRDNLLNYSEQSAFTVMQGWFSHTLSYLPNDKILPVFIGTHITSYRRDELLCFIKKNPKYFKNIIFGCRDSSTLNFMRYNGLQSYLSRCLTLTFPKREINKEYNKIFIVDIPTEFINYIPKTIINNSEIVSQRYCDVNKDNTTYCFYKNYLVQTEELLNKYKDTASLVITSALHCASPCIAMGIPTVLIDFEDKNDRFGSLDGIIKIYSKNDLIKGNIDYNPKTIDIEDLKLLMKKNVELSIKEAFDEDIDRQELNNIRQQIENYSLQK